jgi:predicted CXXCH cytochrome family protein
LAHLVQKVATLSLLCAGIGTPAQTFSHRVHLQLKLNCLSCHANASSSTRVEDNLLPNPAICLSCHSAGGKGVGGKAPALAGGPAIKPPRVSHIAKFSHQRHLQMGNVAPVIAAAIQSGKYLGSTGAAIRPLLDNAVQSKNACTACHRGMEQSDAVSDAAFPQMADCLVCHSKIEPPFSCTTCHAENAKLSPPSHDAKWLDFHASGKANLDKQSCAVCHGRQFTCRGCH